MHKVIGTYRLTHDNGTEDTFQEVVSDNTTAVKVYFPKGGTFGYGSTLVAAIEDAYAEAYSGL